MSLSRRAFLGSSTALAYGLVHLRARAQDDTDRLFDRSTVIDALSADEDWNDPEPIFVAYKKSGLTAIQTSLANASLASATRDLTAWQGRFDKWPDRIVKVTKAAQIAEAKKSGRVGVILGFQNATMVERDVANLDKLFAAGTRCIQLTYNEHNLLGDGCTQAKDGGLTSFGHDVVVRMNQLGIVVDLSHCGLVTSADGIKASTRPPAFTHTVCKAIHDHVRAKPDELLKAMSGKGGMTGIATLGYFVGPTAETSVEDYLRHIEHAVRVAGIDHVGLASDYSIRGIGATRTRENWYVPRLSSFPPEYHVRWPPWIPELDPPERYRVIAHGLAKRGFTTTQIEKVLGGNWARYFGEILR